MIKPKFTLSEFKKAIEKKVKDIDTAILSGLKFIAEKFVTDARSENTYKDQTGNLRSSIGYIIFKDGVRVYRSFPGNKASAILKAVTLAEEVAANFPKGYLLVVVAGMEYAGAVESRGLNVITTQAFKAQDDIIKMVQRIKSKI